MLQAINDRIKGWLGIVIVVLIGLPFALWGIQSYLDDAGPRFAAKINNIEISPIELERAVSRQRQSLLSQNNGILPVDEQVLRESALSQMINQKLLEDFTYQNEYRISDRVLSERIRQLFTVDGIFDRDRFELVVSSNGMSIPMFEQALRNELRLQQIQSALTTSGFVTNIEANNLAALEQQTRDITVLTFNLDHYSTSTTSTDEEIEQYYKANLQRFMKPEKIKVDYVEINSDDLATDIEVDEKRIQQMYDDYVTSLNGREQRKTRHILIKSSDKDAMSKIEKLKQDLTGGADFAALAKKHSQDTGSAVDGGDLDWVAMGEMVKPFEQVLFEMEKGSVSDIVETQFGYHLIKLDDVRSEPVASLAVKRYEFEAELKSENVSSVFYDLSERLAASAYENPQSLIIVAENLGLTLKTSDYFERQQGDGIASNDKLRNIAFSDQILVEGNNSDIIEINPDHVVVVHMNEHVSSKAIPLQEVSSKIEKILKVKNGNEKARAAALEAKSKIETGAAIDNFKVDGVSIDTITGLGRKDAKAVSDPSILQKAFSIVEGKTGKASVEIVDLNNGDVALVVLSKVNSSEKAQPAVVSQVKAAVHRENVSRDFSSILSSIENSATITRNIRETK